jgi:nucleoside phosphorylase
MNAPPERVLVCFALPGEARPFRRRAGARPHVRVWVTGMGRDNARRALREALAVERPAVVLTCGLAGGLHPALARGAVLFSAAPDFPGSARLVAAGARPAVFHCADRIAATAAEKRRLREATGADAVEMESAAIAAVCRETGVPCATVRVISDAADEDLPLDFNRYLRPDFRLDWPRLLSAVALRPGRWRALRALQQQTRAAAERLAEVLAAVTADPRW